MSIVVLYKGHRGCGKTLTMVKDGFQDFKAGYKILRNFEASFGEYITEEDILNLDKNSNIRNCIILIDEVQIFFDSRRGMRKAAINFSNFIQQIRKRNISIYGTTQYANTIDLRFRQHTDIIAYPNFFKDLNVCEVLYVDVTTSEDILITNIEPKVVKIVYDAKPIYPLYNTGEMIK